MDYIQLCRKKIHWKFLKLFSSNILLSFFLLKISHRSYSALRDKNFTVRFWGYFSTNILRSFFLLKISHRSYTTLPGKSWWRRIFQAWQLRLNIFGTLFTFPLVKSHANFVMEKSPLLISRGKSKGGESEAYIHSANALTKIIFQK